MWTKISVVVVASPGYPTLVGRRSGYSRCPLCSFRLYQQSCPLLLLSRYNILATLYASCDLGHIENRYPTPIAIISTSPCRQLYHLRGLEVVLLA
jgi:hypothetical protein